MDLEGCFGSSTENIPQRPPQALTSAPAVSRLVWQPGPDLLQSQQTALLLPCEQRQLMSCLPGRLVTNA